MKRIAAICAALLCAAAYLAWRQLFYLPEVHDYQDAKLALEQYVVRDHRVTLYCGARFGGDKRVELPEGFEAPGYAARAGRVEWDHAVPAAKFGRTFKAWTEGHRRCEKNGKPYKGRKCAEQVSREFREMEADMHNLFPVIGAVNAVRGNRAYAELPGEADFGSCGAKAREGRFEPPDRAKGQVARASLYMEERYKRLRLSDKQRNLFTAWSAKFPVDKWECRRARRIERIQGNDNRFVREPCEKAGLW